MRDHFGELSVWRKNVGKLTHVADGTPSVVNELRSAGEAIPSENGLVGAGNIAFEPNLHARIALYRNHYKVSRHRVSYHTTSSSKHQGASPGANVAAAAR